MIAAIIIISLALGWLLIETNFMRVRLLVGCFEDIDHELNFDGSDIDYLADYERQLEEAVLDADYQAWIDERHAPKLVYNNRHNGDKVAPRDKWLVLEEDLTKRRLGEMIYQRGI